VRRSHHLDKKATTQCYGTYKHALASLVHSNAFVGANSQTRRTRHGTAMAFCLSLTVTHDFKMSPARILVGLYAKYRCSKGPRYQSPARKSR
jgi:hypothetical protein